MHQGTHALIGAAKAVTVPVAKPVISFSPVVLPVKNRPLDLEVRVTVPATGSPLPIILLAHGHGRSNWLSSLEGYAPLSEFWAAHGFAVLQPTHLRSAVYGLKAPPGNDMFWKDGPKDMSAILDNLDSIEDLVPGLKGRLDRSRVAVAGHSAGAQTASLLLGAKNKDPREDFTYHRPESRVKAGLLLACLGNRGNNLNDVGKKQPRDSPNLSISSIVSDMSSLTPVSSRSSAWFGVSNKTLVVWKATKPPGSSAQPRSSALGTIFWMS